MSRSTSRTLLARVPLMVVAAVLLATSLAAPGDGAVSSEPVDQEVPAAAQAPAGMTAEEAADAAVQEWLNRRPVSVDRIAAGDIEQLCRELPGLVTQPAPPPGTQVNLTDRVERTTPADGDVRVFTYPASRPNAPPEIVEARVRPSGDGWETVRVGFWSDAQLTGARAWLQTPLRRWLAVTRAAVAEHRRLVIVTLVALYGVFGLGVVTGSSLPDSCDAAVVEIVQGAITALGATDAYGSGDVPRAAAVTFYQNFVVVTLSVTFTLAAVLGVPAYLFAAFSFFAQGVPFGMLGGGGAVELLVLLVVLVLELTSYFFVVAGGGMLLATIWRNGFAGIPVAFRKLLSTLPVAMVLLMAGAWFEAAALIIGF
jgi:hypothetical protein